MSLFQYRRMSCNQPTADASFRGINGSNLVGETSGIKASAKYWSTPGPLVGSETGSLIICSHNRPGTFRFGFCPTLVGHRGDILDHDWDPFIDSRVATGGEDGLIKIWELPEDFEPIDENGGPAPGGYTDHDQYCLMTLQEHSEKVTYVQFHPSAANILLSASADGTTIVWDLDESGAIVSTHQTSAPPQDIAWDARGEHYAISTKDKCIRIIQARTGEEILVIEGAHDGSNMIKLQWLDTNGIEGKIITTGSNSQNGQEMKVWDLKDTSKPFYTEQAHIAADTLFPLFDMDSSVLYLCGKAHGQIHPYRYSESSSYVLRRLNEGFSSSLPGKGYCLVPKRALDVMGCETARILKFAPSAREVQPLSFIVPSDSDAFQEDLFPPAKSATPAHSAQEWVGGSSKLPLTMSLDPASPPPVEEPSGLLSLKDMKTQNEQMKAHIESLEKKLADASITFEPFQF